MKKYRYFIPIIGFILATIDNIRSGSDFDKYYREGLLGLAFVASLLMIHLPSMVGLGFLIIDYYSK